MEDIDVDVIIAFSSAKPCLSVQFFEILILSRHFWGNVHHVREINLISS